MGNAERADVIVDFSALPEGTRIRMINTGPDSPFGSFPVGAAMADPGTTGQVMEFVVKGSLLLPSDLLTSPAESLVLPAEAALGAPDNTRQLSLNEASSGQACFNAGGVPFGHKAALLGTVAAGVSTALNWDAPITEQPLLGDTEIWEIFNLTEDAHPIHLHLVRFGVIDRQPLQISGPVLFGNPVTMPAVDPAIPATPADSTEAGYKDTVIVPPGQVTRVKAKFDRAGLFVWHCHIVEHEDNEMMRPFVVR